MCEAAERHQWAILDVQRWTARFYCVFCLDVTEKELS